MKNTASPINIGIARGNRKSMYRRFLLSSALAMLIPQVHAANGEWTTVASTCVPDEASVGRYQFEQARFEFSGANTGQIVSRCNITDPADLLNDNPIWDRMDVTYDDPDGFFAGSRVRVQLRRVHETTGASATFATFDSNAFPPGQQLKTIAFVHPDDDEFDFYNYAYYLTIIVDRNSANAVPRIERVRLYLAPEG
ncbi:MAG: hypothetical protein ACREYF_04030 [Gammaproteobacteria bacterium]